MKIEELKKADAVTVFKHLSPGGLIGFDYARRSREELITEMLTRHGADRVNQAISSTIPAPTVAAPAAPNNGNGNGNPIDAITRGLQALTAHAGLSAEQVTALIDSRLADVKPTERLVVVNAQTGAHKEVKGHKHEIFEKILKKCAYRKPIFLSGPSGSGKSYLARQLADALDLPFSAISCNGGMGENHLSGWLLPTGEHGRFNYVASAFVEFYQTGGVFLLDEICSASDDVLIFINDAISNGHMNISHKIDGNREIKRHKDFILIAADNTWGTSGNAQHQRNRLDAATLDRFASRKFYMDYCDKLEETLVLPDVLSWGRKIRQAIKSNRLERIMSTRTLIDITEMVANGESFSDCRADYFVDWQTDELSAVRGAK